MRRTLELARAHEESKEYREYLECLLTLESVLTTRNVHYFQARELIQFHAGTPPENLLRNIVPTVQLLDRLRKEGIVGKIRVTSGYRSPEYNQRVGGAPRSLHKSFNALDVTTAEGPGHIIMGLEEYYGRKFLARTCGVGTYDSFVHLDTRTLMFGLEPARW